MSEHLPSGVSSASFGSDFTLESLPWIAASGFTHLEVFPPKVPWLQTLDEFRLLGRQARDNGLVTWSLHAPFGFGISAAAADESIRSAALQAVSEALEQALALGAGLVVVHPGYYDLQTEARDAALRRAVESYRVLCRRAAECGLQLALEYLPPKPADLGSSAAELLWLQEQIGGSVGFCLDVNHANLPEDVTEVVRQLGPSVLTTHLSDNDGLQERHWLPGEGVINWPALMAALRAVQYRGPLLLEAGNFSADTLEQKVAALAQAARYLQAVELV